jgi:hypothetical protein
MWRFETPSTRHWDLSDFAQQGNGKLRNRQWRRENNTRRRSRLTRFIPSSERKRVRSLSFYQSMMMSDAVD